MMPRAGLAALALVPLLLSPPAEAAPRAHHMHVSLRVKPRAGAHGCPSEGELRRDVTAILGYGPFEQGARRRITSVLSASGGVFHARIELLDVRTGRRLGVRELSSAGPTCADLGAAMALAIALAIDPLAQPPPPVAATKEAALPVATVEATRASALSSAAASAGAPRGPAHATADATPAVAATAAPPEQPETPAPVPPPSSPVAGVDAGTDALATAPPSPAEGGADAGLPLIAAPVDAGVPSSAAPELPVPVPVPASVVAAPPETPPPGAAAAPAPWHGLAGVGAVWTLGAVPRHAFGVVAHGGVAWSFASVELEARWLPATSLAFQSGTISTSQVTGTLVGCARFAGFGACGLFQAGPLSSTGNGFAQSQSSTTWMAALGARVQWDWVFAHPVGLRVQVDGLVNLVRTRLLVGPDAVWQAPSFGLAAGAGVFLVF